MSQELVPIRGAENFLPVFTIDDAIRRREAIVEYTRAAMKEGQDYGKIPGSDKNVLLKPGAEKLCTLFGLTPRFTIVRAVEDWTGAEHGGEPFFHYLTSCSLYRGENLIASADACCNSFEKKYRYRNAERVCPHCGKPAIIKGRPEYGGGYVCFARKGGCGAKFSEGDKAIESQHIGQVPNPDVADLVNTILKISEKRALVAACLIAVNASEFFTQDIMEDAPIDTSFAPVPAEAPAPAPAPAAPIANRAEEETIEEHASSTEPEFSPVEAMQAFQRKAQDEYGLTKKEANVVARQMAESIPGEWTAQHWFELTLKGDWQKAVSDLRKRQEQRRQKASEEDAREQGQI